MLRVEASKSVYQKRRCDAIVFARHNVNTDLHAELPAQPILQSILDGFDS
jgi:hypothetical protein